MHPFQLLKEAQANESRYNQIFKLPIVVWKYYREIFILSLGGPKLIEQFPTAGKVRRNDFHYTVKDGTPCSNSPASPESSFWKVTKLNHLGKISLSTIYGLVPIKSHTQKAGFTINYFL